MRVWGLFVLVGCTSELPPEGAILLYLDTDAPLPAAIGAELDAPAPLFDSVLVEVFEPGAAAPCPGCTRIFALDSDVVRAEQASFGIPTEPGVAGYRARLRLYDSSSTDDGTVPEPLPDGSAALSVVEAVVALPAVGEEGIVELSAFLPTDAVGAPSGTLELPSEPSAGPPGGSRVGSWPGALRVSCGGAPQAGEVCVPGGAFWMGHPHARGDGSGNAADHRRLVVLSPFYLDSTEVTVAQYRLFHDGTLPIDIWSGGNTGNDVLDYCNFTTAPGPRDDHPVDCLSFSSARAYCQARGADLPTEAQLEYAAGGLEGRQFVWGQDVPSCEDAVLSRTGYGVFASVITWCQPPTPPGGTEPVGAAVLPLRRDRLELDGGIVFDLTGNVGEWALDRWQRQTEPCWSHAGVYLDPRCDEPSPSDGDQRSLRGGSWHSPLIDSIAAARRRTVETAELTSIGFRCARAAPP